MLGFLPLGYSSRVEKGEEVERTMSAHFPPHPTPPPPPRPTPALVPLRQRGFPAQDAGTGNRRGSMWLSARRFLEPQ